MKNLLKGLHKKFQNLIAYLVYERNWLWLSFIISTLCDLEMSIKLLLDSGFYNDIQSASIKRLSPIKDECAPMEKVIPHGTMYCEDCGYQDFSIIAKFFYGYQCCGYCYFLNNGDYRFSRPTSLLWDGCKECGMYEDIDVQFD